MMHITNNARSNGGSEGSVTQTDGNEMVHDAQSNQLDDMAHNALDAFAAATEQSHDTFMEGFTHLSRLDVINSEALSCMMPEALGAVATPVAGGSEMGSFPSIHQLRAMLTGKAAKDQRNANLKAFIPSSDAMLTSESIPSCDAMLTSESMNSSSDATVEQTRPVLDEDNLEEMVLSEGMRIQPYLIRNATPTSHTAVKVGNFLDDECSLSSDGEEDAKEVTNNHAYQASFLLKSNSVVPSTVTHYPTSQANSCETELAKECADNHTKIPGDQMTEDLTEEMEMLTVNNVSSESATGTVTASARESKNDHGKIHTRFHETDNTSKESGGVEKNGEEVRTKSSQILSTGTLPTESVSLASPVTESNSVTSQTVIHSNSLTVLADNDIGGTTINRTNDTLTSHTACHEGDGDESGSSALPPGCSDDTGPDSCSHCIQPGNPSAALFRQSYGPSDQEFADTASDSDVDELKYDPTLDLPNPGEIEDVQVSKTETELLQIRHLNFAARMKKPEELVQEMCQANTTETGDAVHEVEPFQLDENFDYDNVTLTPKFTAEEMAYLNSLAPKHT